MHAALASPEAEAVTADVANFLGLGQFRTLMLVEQEVSLLADTAA